MKRLWVVLLALAGWVTAEAQVGARIPAVKGAALSGEAVVLPEGLRGKVGVLVVGFSQSSRGEVTAWGKRLAGDYRESGGVIYYEMALLASVPRLVRGWVLGRIKGSVPLRAQGRFLPVIDHEGEWKAVAGYGAADDAYVLVVDGAGVVRYRVEGAATDAAYGEVKRRVEGLGGR